MERTKQIWSWIASRIGIVNVILLLPILSITFYIGVQLYLMQLDRQLENERFAYIQQEFERGREKEKIYDDQIDSRHQTDEAIIKAFQSLDKNVGSLTAITKTLESNQTKLLVAARRKPPKPLCQAYNDAQEIKRIGAQLLIQTIKVPNPDYQKCLEGQKKKR